MTMRVRLLTFTLMLLCLTACSNTKHALADNTTYTVETTTINSMTDMFRSADGYLISYGGGYLFFVDADTLETVLACNDPACGHNSPDCGAWESAELQCYGDQLFYIESGTRSDMVSPISLYRRNLGGGSVKEIMSLMDNYDPERNEYNAYLSNMGRWYICFGDHILYVYQDRDVYYNTLGGSLEDAVCILSYDGPSAKLVSTDTSDGLIWSVSEVGSVWNLWRDGDDIYIEGTLPTEQSSQYYMQASDYSEELDGLLITAEAEQTWKQCIYKLNLETLTAEQVWTCPNETDVGFWETANVSVNGWYISDGILYYFLSGNGVWKTELQTGETAKLLDAPNLYGSACFDEDYVYVSTKAESGARKFVIYNLDGTLEEQLVQEDFLRPEDFTTQFDPAIDDWSAEIIGSDETKLFLRVWGQVELPADSAGQLEVQEWVYCLDKFNLSGPATLLAFDKGQNEE